MEAKFTLLSPRVLSDDPGPTLSDGGPVMLKPELRHFHCQLSTTLIKIKSPILEVSGMDLVSHHLYDSGK